MQNFELSASHPWQMRSASAVKSRRDHACDVLARGADRIVATVGVAARCGGGGVTENLADDEKALAGSRPHAGE